MLAGILLCILSLGDQLSAHKYYGEKCIPDSEILLPDGRCFCSPRGVIDLCVGLFEREDIVMRNEREKNQTGRIVGGNSASIALHPYVVAFEKNGILWCGATIIGDDWAITAAHCFDRTLDHFKCAKNIQCQIRAGSSKTEKAGFLFDVVQIFVHENYNEQIKNHAYDLAVVRVNKPFRNASEALITVKLPDENYDMPKGTMVTVLGWGTTKEQGDMATKLQEIQVPIVSRATCRYVHGRLITSHMVCAGYREGKKDSCQGDSGGPMIINDTLVGLVAFGQGCARPERPGVYTKVASFRGWIKDKAGV